MVKMNKSELTWSTIVSAAVSIAASRGVDAVSLQAVANRTGLSKSGVFSRIGSRDALVSVVIDELKKAFFADILTPALREPQGLPRLAALVRLWIIRTGRAGAHHGCIYPTGVDPVTQNGPIREKLLGEILRWRSLISCHVADAIRLNHLPPETDVSEFVADVCRLLMVLSHDVRFLRDTSAVDRAQDSWARMLRRFRALESD